MTPISSSTEAPGSSPLRVRPFRRVLIASTVNEFGYMFGALALSILVYERTGSALATAGLFLSVRFLPALVAPALSARVQTLAPRRILPLLYVAECAIAIALAFFARHFSLPAVLVLGSIDGAIAITAAALTRGINAALLGTGDLLRRGYAALNVSLSIADTIGPVLAGVLISAVGVAACLLLDAAAFLVIALILVTTAGLHLDSARHTNWRARLRTGLDEIWTHVGVRRLLVAQAAALVFFSSVLPIEVIYATHTLRVGDTGYGVLLAAWGFGMVLGSILYAAAKQRSLLLMLAASAALIGIGYAGMGVSRSLVVAVVFSAIGGLGNGAEAIAFVTAVQQSISTGAQTSVMAVVGSINRVMPGIGFVVGGVVATAGSPRTTLLVAAAGVFVVLALALLCPPIGVGASLPEDGTQLLPLVGDAPLSDSSTSTSEAA